MANTNDKPITLVVRRGALRRFDKLKRETANLPVVVTCDRRQADPGGTHDGVPSEADRRKQAPFTWELADFVVVPPGEPDPSDT